MKLQMHSNMTLSQLKEGALEELYQQALGMVLANAQDPNTEAKAKRNITIKFTFTPTPDRSVIQVDASVTTKICAANPVQTAMIVKVDGDRLVGFEPEQENLFSAAQAN